MENPRMIAGTMQTECSLRAAQNYVANALGLVDENNPQRQLLQLALQHLQTAIEANGAVKARAEAALEMF